MLSGTGCLCHARSLDLGAFFRTAESVKLGPRLPSSAAAPGRLEAREGQPSQEKTTEQNQLRDRSGLMPGSSPGRNRLLPSLAASLPARSGPFRPEVVLELSASRGSGQRPRGTEVAAWPGLPGAAAGAQGGLNLCGLEAGGPEALRGVSENWEEHGRLSGGAGSSITFPHLLVTSWGRGWQAAATGSGTVPLRT